MSDEKQAGYYPFVPPSMYFTWQRVPMKLERLNWDSTRKCWMIEISVFFQRGRDWYSTVFFIDNITCLKIVKFEYDEFGITMKCLEKFYRLAQAQFFKRNPDDLPPIIP